ncbi:MAG: sigma-54-dependent Fis family transcriptional regulator [Planctomycetaceae bacterium]|nr:sigma-54 dependent transcriptional regulator [Planctomycetota bacterium]NUN51273.1 sigma-54-dependent Fis family transcriptional regulator [Planctomycetaceae bacterium]
MTSRSRRRVLVADDDEAVRRVVHRHLEDAGYGVESVPGGAEALARLRGGERPDVLVTDLQMPGLDGLTLLAEAKRLDPALPAIVITAHGSVETAVDAMRKGAYDYVEKPFHRDVLLLTIERALRHRMVLEENLRLTEALAREFSLGNLVGGSSGMQEVFRLAGRAAPTEAPVLLLGESGTGKELLARALHYNSARAGRPFVTVNVAAIPESLVEPELFGVVKGAFTGAVASRTGLFQQADGGTLFLDEIGEMRIDLQAKLLRTLESGEFRPVGSEREEHADVRIVAATNRDLASAVEDGAFRRDLYHRIAVVVLRIPPLRERIEDLPLLLRHFLGKHRAAGLEVSPEAMKRLADWHWPGNVRELENEIRRAVLLRGSTGSLQPGDLSPEIQAGRPARGRGDGRLDLRTIEIPDEGINLSDLEKEVLSMALRKTGGNQTKAAALVGITRQTLIYRMEKHGLK